MPSVSLPSPPRSRYSDRLLHSEKLISPEFSEATAPALSVGIRHLGGS